MGERSDKKLQLAPHVLPRVAEVVHDIALHLGTDQGNVVRLLTLIGAGDFPTLNRLAPYFWRSLERGEVVWPGHSDYMQVRELIAPRGHQLTRTFTRVHQSETHHIDDIAFSLGSARAHAAAAVLTIVSKDLRVIQKVAPQFQFRSPYSLREGAFLWDSGTRR